MGIEFCNGVEDWGVDQEAEMPHMYVKAMRERHMQNLMNEDDGVDEDEMTIEQLKEYYDKGGARRIKKMDAKGQ